MKTASDFDIIYVKNSKDAENSRKIAIFFINKSIKPFAIESKGG